MSDELRDLVRREADSTPVPPGDLADVVRGGRARRWRGRLYSVTALVVVAALVWTAMPGARSDHERTPPAGTSHDDKVRANCADVGIRPTYLPEEWSYVTYKGSGDHHGTPVKGEGPDALMHWTTIDPEGGDPYIDIWLYIDKPSLQSTTVGDPVYGVLDGIGDLDKAGDDYFVRFHAGGCRYVMIGVGVAQRDVRLVARGLEWADTCDKGTVVGPDAELADGRYFVYITGVDIFEHGQGIQFDKAEFLTGAEANEAAAAAGAIEEGDTVPNDYFIVNQSERTAALGFADDVKVHIDTLHDGMPGLAPADTGSLACQVATTGPRLPFWITVEDRDVVKLEAQYLP